ncbi:hypothetical protein L195_g054733, partial [Trifolium pratense]
SLYYEDDLRGCRNDANKILNSLLGNCGFDYNNVELVVDEGVMVDEGVIVSHQSICDAITRMVNASVAGYTLLVFMSGHGGVYVPRDGSGRTTSYLIAGEVFLLQMLSSGCSFLPHVNPGNYHMLPAIMIQGKWGRCLPKSY